MPYRTMLEKRLEILNLFCDENVPRTQLKIARAIGYKDASAIRVVLQNMFDEGIFYRHEQKRPNGQIRFVFLMADEGKKERDLVAKAVYRVGFNGIG